MKKERSRFVGSLAAIVLEKNLLLHEKLDHQFSKWRLLTIWYFYFVSTFSRSWFTIQTVLVCRLNVTGDFILFSYTLLSLACFVFVLRVQLVRSFILVSSLLLLLINLMELCVFFWWSNVKKKEKIRRRQSGTAHFSNADFVSDKHILLCHRHQYHRD